MNIVVFVLLLFFMIYNNLCLDNNLGLTPPMGWNSHYVVNCNDINEALIREITDIFNELKLNEYGYEYINVDQCWQGGRYSNGTIHAHSPQFNKSLQSLSDYIHSYNLKFGLYTARTKTTPNGNVGSLGYEINDANTFAKWNVDYLREGYNSKDGQNNENIAFSEYAKMRDALNATGKQIFFSIRSDYIPTQICMNLANSWISNNGVPSNWNHILTIFDKNAQYELENYSGPGGWNHQGFLLANGPNAKITELQSRAQFSMYAILAAPLLISSDIRSITNYVLETYTNKYVINVNQDKLGKQGIRIYGDNLYYNKTQNSNGLNIWSRELIDGSRVMLFLNINNFYVDMVCDVQCFNNAGFTNGINVQIYDLWNNNKYIANISTSQSFVIMNIEPNGGHAMYKMIPYY